MAREAGKSPAETTRTEDDARVAEAMSGDGPRQSGRPKVINPYVKKGTQARRITNEEGHKAGGDRRSERYMLSNQPVDRNQATLDSLVRRPAAGDDDGDDESSTSSSSSDVSSEEGSGAPNGDVEAAQVQRKTR